MKEIAVAEKRIDLGRDENAATDEDQIFRPVLFQPKPDAFGKEQDRIEQRADSDMVEGGRSQGDKMLLQAAYDAVLGIGADRLYYEGGNLAKIRVDQLEDSPGNAQEKDALENLKSRDDPQTQRVMTCHI